MKITHNIKNKYKRWQQIIKQSYNSDQHETITEVIKLKLHQMFMLLLIAMESTRNRSELVSLLDDYLWVEDEGERCGYGRGSALSFNLSRRMLEDPAIKRLEEFLKHHNENTPACNH